jgi:hypothetical protein
MGSIHEKNQRSTISCYCTFNVVFLERVYEVLSYQTQPQNTGNGIGIFAKCRKFNFAYSPSAKNNTVHMCQVFGMR